jgi:hypothetical protein
MRTGLPRPARERKVLAKVVALVIHQIAIERRRLDRGLKPDREHLQTGNLPRHADCRNRTGPRWHSDSTAARPAAALGAGPSIQAPEFWQAHREHAPAVAAYRYVIKQGM